MAIGHNVRENTSATQNPTLMPQNEFIDVNSDRNSTNTEDLTISSQSSMIPDGTIRETYSPQEAQLSHSDNEMSNSRPSILENGTLIETGVNSYPAQQENNIQHQGHDADATLRTDHPSLLPGETPLINASFSNNHLSFQNSLQTQFSFSRQSQLNLFELSGANYNSNMESPFPINQTNLLERVASQLHSLDQLPYLGPDQLDCDFLNRELFDFDIDLLDITEQSSEMSPNFNESPERELDQSNKASQFSSTNAEEHSVNQYHFSKSIAYIDGSNQTSDSQLEQSNHSVEFLSQFYGKSVESGKITKIDEMWEEEGDEPMNQLKNKNNRNVEENTCDIIPNEKWAFTPVDVITPDESRRLPSISDENTEPDRLGVIEDVAADDVMNKVVDENNPKVGGGRYTMSHEELLFYEARMKEIDAIDSALSAVEKKIKMDSNGYDLESTNAENIEMFQHILYSKGETELFTPGTMEIIVMPLTIQPGDSPLSCQTEEAAESSETHDPPGESGDGGSNVPESSTSLETEPRQDTGSQFKMEEDQLHDDAAVANEASSTESSSFTPIQQTTPCNTSVYSPHMPEKTPEGESGGVNLESRPDCFANTHSITPGNENIQEDSKNDPKAIINKAKEKALIEGETENMIPETTAQSPAICSDYLLASDTEAQGKLEEQHSTEELPESTVKEFSREVEMNPLIKIEPRNETENDQPLKEEPSAEVSSVQPFSQPETQTLASSSSNYSAQGDNTLEKGSEDEHGGVSVKSGGQDLLGETLTLTHDNETNQVVDENNPNIVEETTSFDEAKENLHGESEIKANEKIDVVLPLTGKNTQPNPNADDLSSSTSANRTEAIIKHNEGRTGSFIQGTAAIIALPSAILPEHKSLSETKTQETSDVQNPAGELPESITSETSPKPDMHPLGNLGTQSETNTDKSSKEGTSTEVLSIEPSSSQIEIAQSIIRVHSTEEHNAPEKRSEDEYGGVGSCESQTRIPDVEINPVADKNDPNVVDDPVIFDKAGINLCHECKIKANERIDTTFPLKEQNTPTDLNAYILRSSASAIIETNIKHIEGRTDNVISENVGVTTMVPTAILSEHQLPCETITQETSEMHYPASELSKPNISESLTMQSVDPLGITGSQTETNVDEPSKEGSSAEFSPSSLTRTEYIPIPDEPNIEGTIHDNIEIEISPTELAWLSEPDTQTEIRSHPSIEKLENYQTEQVPLSIEGMLHITMPDTPQNQESTEELCDQIYSEQLSGPCLPEVSAMVEQKTSDRTVFTVTEHFSSEVAPQSISSDVPQPPSSSMDPPSIVVGPESDSSTTCIESITVPPIESVQTSKATCLVEQEGQPTAHDPSDDEIPPAKRKRTESKPVMKLRVKETRKSSRLKKSPERLFYIGKGQLF